MNEAAAPMTEHRFPCDNCGADFRFDPARALLSCDHCGNTAPLEGIGRSVTPIRELDLRQALDEQLPLAEIEVTRVSTCPNCAAQVEFDADVHAAEWPFCAKPVVTDTGAHRHIKPKGLLPLGLTEEDARNALEAGTAAKSSVEQRINRVRENFHMQRPARIEDIAALQKKGDQLSRKGEKLARALADQARQTKKAPAKKTATKKAATKKTSTKKAVRKKPAPRKKKS